MPTVRPSDLVLPVLWGGLAGLLLGLAVGRGTGHVWAGAVVGVGVVVAVVGRAAAQVARRRRATRRPLSEASRAWLRAHVALYRLLAGAERRRFEATVQGTLADLTFEGAGGVEPTDDLRLAVAAGAAVLLHGRPGWRLPAERTVLFVPDTFDEAYGDEEPGLYDGMVHAQGPVVLSAAAVRDGWAREDGQNVVLHELAHLLDFTSEGADGAPSLLDPRSAEAWDQLVRDEMRRAQRGDGILRAYAGTAPAELFAVATEQFFERPARLRNRHPELFDALVAVYNLTPPDESLALDDRGSFMERRWARE